MKKIILIFILFIMPCYAAEDFYHFDSTERQQRFETLTSQLRCLVCQNQNLAESNAGLANDLRDQVYQKIQQGLTDEEIVNYLVTRYGDFILYRPPLNALTLGLWLSPFLLLLTGLGYLFYYVQKKRRE